MIIKYSNGQINSLYDKETKKWIKVGEQDKEEIKKEKEEKTKEEEDGKDM